MDVRALIGELRDLAGFPVGTAGSRMPPVALRDTRVHDIFVFDGRQGQTDVVNRGNEFAVIHHASLSETDSRKLLEYDGLDIVRDESWDLRMLLSRITAMRQSLLTDSARSSLVECMFYCQKTRDSLDASGAFAPCWQKCASYCLADAICLLNGQAPGPAGMLDQLRKFDKGHRASEHIRTATQTVGIERATPVLLGRMLKSTVGLADLAGAGEGQSGVIRHVHDTLVGNSMLSDCYFYLGHVNRDSLAKIGDPDRMPGLVHILKVAFDVEADPCLLSRQAGLVQASCNAVLGTIASLQP